MGPDRNPDRFVKTQYPIENRIHSNKSNSYSNRVFALKQVISRVAKRIYFPKSFRALQNWGANNTLLQDYT